MKISTRKAIRTFLQGVIASAAAIPVIVPTLDFKTGMVAKVAAAVIVAAAIVTKVWNAIEARFPGASKWLFGGATSTVDTGTGERVTAPAAVSALDVPKPPDGGYAVPRLLTFVVLVFAVALVAYAVLVILT